MLAFITKDQGPWFCPCFQFRLFLFLPERTESNLFRCPNFTEKMQSTVRTRQAPGCVIMPQEYSTCNQAFDEHIGGKQNPFRNASGGELALKVTHRQLQTQRLIIFLQIIARVLNMGKQQPDKNHQAIMWPTQTRNTSLQTVQDKKSNLDLAPHGKGEIGTEDSYRNHHLSHIISLPLCSKINRCAVYQVTFKDFMIFLKPCIKKRFSRFCDGCWG